MHMACIDANNRERDENVMSKIDPKELLPPWWHDRPDHLSAHDETLRETYLRERGGEDGFREARIGFKEHLLEGVLVRNDRGIARLFVDLRSGSAGTTTVRSAFLRFLGQGSDPDGHRTSKERPNIVVPLAQTIGRFDATEMATHALCQGAQSVFNRTQQITDEETYIDTWTAYRNLMLAATGSLRHELISPQKQHAIGSENHLRTVHERLAQLETIFELAKLFPHDRLRNDPLHRTWATAFVGGQRAKLANSMWAIQMLREQIDRGRAQQKHLTFAAQAIVALHDPLDHIRMSYVREDSIWPFVLIELPSEDKLQAFNPIALREMVDRIVYAAGTAGAQRGRATSLWVYWDVDRRELSFTDETSTRGALDAFADGAQRDWLEALAPVLGNEGALALEHDHDGHVEAVVITVPQQEAIAAELPPEEFNEGAVDLEAFNLPAATPPAYAFTTLRL